MLKQTINFMSGYNKGGRPRKTEKLKRNHIYHIRFSESEYLDLKKRRLDYGYASVASLIHYKLFGKTHCNDSGALPAAQLLVISGIIKEVNAIGKNVNQVVKKIEFMDTRAEKPLLYESIKIEEMLSEVRQHEEKILEILNLSTAQFGFSPMRPF